MNPILIVPVIVGSLLVACGVLLLVFKKRIMRRGNSWQIYSLWRQRNLKIATAVNIFYFAFCCFLFGLVLLLAGITSWVN